MIIKDVVQRALGQLQKIYDRRESNNILKICFEDLFEITNLESEREFEYDEVFQKVISRLLNHEPIQYIVERADFYGYRFKVNKHVLIPRPETEELVHWLLTDYKKNRRQLDLIDVGLGSGCIALTIRKEQPSFRVFGIEVSLDALNVARINSKRLQSPCTFYAFNFLIKSYWQQLGKFDIIVSNPPYIATSESRVMADNVLLYEPEIALFAHEDPLSFYKAILDFSLKHLRENGRIYLEVGEFNSQEIVSMYSQFYAEVVLKNDLQGRPRMLRVSDVLR